MDIDYNKVLLHVREAQRMLCPGGWTLGERFSRNLHSPCLLYVWGGGGFLSVREGDAAGEFAAVRAQVAHNLTQARRAARERAAGWAAGDWGAAHRAGRSTARKKSPGRVAGRKAPASLKPVADGPGAAFVTHRLAPGGCLWLAPGRMYLAEHRHPEPLGLTFVRFQIEGGADAAALRAREPGPLAVEDAAFLRACMEKLVALHDAPVPEVGHAAAASSALLRALLTDLDTPRRRSSPVPRARMRLRSFTREGQVRELAVRLRGIPGGAKFIHKLAAECGITPAHFDRSFKRVTGEAPKTFLLRQRWRHARWYLRYSTLSIAEVARLLGFRPGATFTNQFRRAHGVAPEAYRLRCDCDE
ncbi:MAG: helix-turn-helix transcriptional regulator [Planctomycetes bacterium]|nr:helix-turn-helix transcriptional regulator [Planctomycetota bacterium]